MIYYEDENYAVKWNETIKVAILERKPTPYVAGDLMRVSALKLLELIEKYNAKKYLHDGREVKVASLADQEWLTQVFFPRFQELKVKYSAIVVPKSTLTQISLDSLRTETESYQIGERRYFSDVKEALNWLRSVEE